jgi:hypothetical protein
MGGAALPFGKLTVLSLSKDIWSLLSSLMQSEFLSNLTRGVNRCE